MGPMGPMGPMGLMGMMGMMGLTGMMGEILRMGGEPVWETSALARFAGRGERV